MPNGSVYPNHQTILATTICDLLYDLGPSTYDEIAPKLEYWIEYVLTEQLMTIDDLVERVSPVAWNQRGARSSILQFLEEFREAPGRSERMRSFVDKLCLYVLRWFGVASADDLEPNWHSPGSTSKAGGYCLIHAACFVGNLIQRSLLSHELVRRHLPKPLTNHHYKDGEVAKQAIRAHAIYLLFAAAGNTLLQGLLEPEDVQVCFERLDTRVSFGEIPGLIMIDPAKLNEFREIHATWLRQKEKEEQRNETPAEVPAAEIETPVAFVPQDLPTIHAGIHATSSTLQVIELVPALRGMESSSDTFVDAHVSAISSPTLSISTISDLTPTEIGEDIEESSDKRIQTRHETFYLEDGNVEIVLRDILSPSTLLSVPMIEGCPRVTLKDSAEDFTVLLKMIHTPGFPARHKVPEFNTFASLLRMATKYGFSDVREALVQDLRGAYPTKWEDLGAAKILGEDIFGSPRPHPNAVLNLLLEQKIKFALPFAAYRAGLGGPSSLASGEPGTILPRLTLASIIHGMGEMRRMMTRVACGVAYDRSLSACAEETCVLNPGANPVGRRTGALKKISEVMIKNSEGDMLSSLEFGNLVCANCAKALEDTHLRYRERFVWGALPSLLVTGGIWEGF